MSTPDFREQNGAGLAERSLGRKFDRSAVLKLLLLAAFLGLVVHRYIEPDFLQALRQAAGKRAAPAPVREESANFYWQQGFDRYKKGDYDQAILSYTKALEMDPRNAKGYYQRGSSYYYKGKYEQALADYNQALEINPRYAEAYSGRGHVYARNGLYDQAIAQFTRALEIKPRDAPSYEWRAYAHYKKKEYDKAWEDVRKSKNLGHEISPKFLQALRQASGRQN